MLVGPVVLCFAARGRCQSLAENIAHKEEKYFIVKILKSSVLDLYPMIIIKGVVPKILFFKYLKCFLWPMAYRWF